MYEISENTKSRKVLFFWEANRWCSKSNFRKTHMIHSWWENHGFFDMRHWFPIFLFSRYFLRKEDEIRRRMLPKQPSRPAGPSQPAPPKPPSQPSGNSASSEAVAASTPGLRQNNMNQFPPFSIILEESSRSSAVSPFSRWKSNLGLTLFMAPTLSVHLILTVFMETTLSVHLTCTLLLISSCFALQAWKYMTKCPVKTVIFVFCLIC